MLLAQSRSSEPNPIVPGRLVHSEHRVLILAVVLLVLLTRWASFHLGFQFGSVKHRRVRDR
jgi:hypothetical protein